MDYLHSTEQFINVRERKRGREREMGMRKAESWLMGGLARFKSRFLKIYCTYSIDTKTSLSHSTTRLHYYSMTVFYRIS